MGILQMTHFRDVRITQNRWLTKVKFNKSQNYKGYSFNFRDLLKLTQEIQALRAYFELLPFRFRCVTPDDIKALEGGDVYTCSKERIFIAATLANCTIDRSRIGDKNK